MHKSKIFIYLSQLSWTTVLCGLIAVLFISPIIYLFIESFTYNAKTLKHIWDTQLWNYVTSSVILTVLTILFSLIIGVPTAYLLARFKFTGSFFFQIACFLSLAYPLYLTAYVYTDLLDYGGIVQKTLRGLMGWKTKSDYYFPQIRSIGGAAIVFALCLFPYILLICRTSFRYSYQQLHQSAQILGASKLKIFFTLNVPLARPAIVVGCALIGMETLGDFGGVSYFGIHTFTTGVYDSWVYLSDLGSAAILAIILLLVILFILLIESHQRRAQRYYHRSALEKVKFKRLTGMKNIYAVIWCSVIITVAFLIPTIQIIYWSYDYFDVSYNVKLIGYAFNSFKVAVITSIVAVILSGFILLNRRIASYKQGFDYKILNGVVFVTSIGYSIPGIVLAISVFFPLISLDHGLNWLWRTFTDNSFGLFFTGSLITLIVAYTIRFLTMSNMVYATGLSKINPNLDLASSSLGTSGSKMVWNIHLPLLKSSIYTAGLLVLIEVLKDLNITLLLRPLNFQTISTNLYTLASIENLEQASLSAVILVFIGIIPVIIMTRNILKD